MVCADAGADAQGRQSATPFPTRATSRWSFPNEDLHWTWTCVPADRPDAHLHRMRLQFAGRSTNTCATEQTLGVGKERFIVCSPPI